MYSEVINTLNSVPDLRYVIVGGFAGVMHGNCRFTADIDIVIELETEATQKLVTAFDQLGLKSVDNASLADLTDTDKRKALIAAGKRFLALYSPENPVFGVDIFLDYPIPFATLYSDSIDLAASGNHFRVCSLPHLIEMKRAAGRAQDLLDIETLEVLQKHRKQ